MRAGTRGPPSLPPSLGAHNFDDDFDFDGDDDFDFDFDDDGLNGDDFNWF